MMYDVHYWKCIWLPRNYRNLLLVADPYRAVLYTPPHPATCRTPPHPLLQMLTARQCNTLHRHLPLHYLSVVTDDRGWTQQYAFLFLRSLAPVSLLLCRSASCVTVDRCCKSDLQDTGTAVWIIINSPSSVVSSERENKAAASTVRVRTVLQYSTTHISG